MQDRIGLHDTGMDVVLKMAEGNPGALAALSEIMRKGVEIDPQCAFGGLGPMFQFDTARIYGSDIYILFNDKCDRDVRKLLMLCRAVQLGFLPQSKLVEMAKDQRRQINLTDDEFAELDKKVCDFLPEFQKAA